MFLKDEPQEKNPEIPERPKPHAAWSRLLFPVLIGLLILSLGSSILSLILLRKVNSRVDDISFNQTVSDYNHDNNLLTPEVGTIQFLKRGYSVVFDSVTYTQNGLQIGGTIGNPTQLALSSLTLKLAAIPFLYDVREKIEKDGFFLYSGLEIGSGEASIGSLGPGQTQTFPLTIPNVRQTADGIQIVASFSGERYSY
jgi:hypothetical protein